MDSPMKKIEQINFGFLSPEDIRNMSVVTVETPDTYEDDGFPIERGLMDPRMGVVDPSLVCTTCGFRGGDCQGHFGHIELARPVIHASFADVIYKMLRSTCNECGRILLNNEQIDNYSERIHKALDNGESLDSILKEVYRVSKRELRQVPEYGEKIDSKYCCPHCGAPQEKILLDMPATIWQGNYKLTDSEVRERLERITDEDSFVLGINPNMARPEWLVLTALPVPPVTVRPSITIESGERAEDDLTHKLVDILRINQRLLENMEAGAPQLIVEDLWELLRYHVTTYFDNKALGVPPARHRSGRPLITLMQRLNGHGKDAMHDASRGRFRENLSGKYVNFSARTVMSPDPNIGISEVGIPEMIAKEMTVPVFVNEWNIEEMRKCIKNGPYVHPGATYVIRKDGRKVRLRYEETIELVLQQLEPGFIVERHLKDGDVVLLNRQPSLHRLSIMAHEVRILPYKTFRVNPAVCPPYNVDFDGDEMNIHVLQAVESRAEAMELMSVQNNMKSPRFGGPLVGAIRDHISGAYLLTKSGTLFTEEEALQIIRKSHIDLPLLKENQWVLKMDSNLKPDSKIPHDIEKSYIYKDRGAMWTGKELFSLALPNDLSMSFPAEISSCPFVSPPEDATVVIKNGILIQGAIDEAAFGSIKGQLLNRILEDYGPEQVVEFLEKAINLSLCTLMKIGITNSLNDYEIPKGANERINEHLDKKMSEVEKLVEAYDEGYLQALPGRNLEQTLVMKIYQVLKEARDIAGGIAENYYRLPDGNLPFSSFGRHSYVMAHTGAKSSMLNITQISACIGQQSIRGQSLNSVFNYRGYHDRLLPHFKKGEIDAKSIGFVKSSFLKGLDPIEFFVHAMSGRDTMVDKSIRISASGYMQRRLVNAMQDLKTDEKGMVRDAQGKVIQFLYGEDGVDTAKSDFGKPADLDRIIDEMRMEDSILDANSFDDDEDDYGLGIDPYEYLSEKEIRKLEIRSDYLSNKIKYTIRYFSEFIYEMKKNDSEFMGNNSKQIITKLETQYDDLLHYQDQCNNFKLHDEISAAINNADNDLKVYKEELNRIKIEIQMFEFYSTRYEELIAEAKFLFDNKFKSYLELNSKLNNLIENTSKLNGYGDIIEFIFNFDEIWYQLDLQYKVLNSIKKQLGEINFENLNTAMEIYEKINVIISLIDKINEINFDYIENSIIGQEIEYKKFDEIFTELKIFESNLIKYFELMNESKFLFDYKLNLYFELYYKLNRLFDNSTKLNEHIDKNEPLNNLNKIESQLNQQYKKLKIIDIESNKIDFEKSIDIPQLIIKINAISTLIEDLNEIDFESIEESIIKQETVYKNPNEIKSESVDKLLNEFEKSFNRPVFIKRQIKKYNLQENELEIIKDDITNDIINHEITDENANFKKIIQIRCEEFRKNNSGFDEKEIDDMLTNITFSDVDEDIINECKYKVKKDILEGNVTINNAELKLKNYVSKRISESEQLEELEQIKNNPNVPSIKVHLTQEETNEIYIVTENKILSEYGIKDVEYYVYSLVKKKIRENQSEARGILNTIKRDFSELTQLDNEQQVEFVNQIELYINNHQIKYYEITEEYIIKLSEDFINYGEIKLR